MRRFPGAIALGLLTAFSAHAILYGNGHVMGGSYGAALRALATVAALGLGAFWLAICWASRKRLCQGSVLTADIGELLPSMSATFAASVCWFWLAESVEEGHAWAPNAAIVAALFLAAAIVRFVAFSGLRELALIAFACDPGGFQNRVPSWIPIADRPIASVPLAHALRLFSRPPPMRFGS